MNRTAKRALAAAAAAVIALGVADTAWASWDEAQLASDGETAYISGFPHALSKVTGEIPRITVERLDAEVPNAGVGTLGVDVVNYDTNAKQADSVRRRVRLDGVGFGSLLGVSDLDMANPFDISPAGGAASEAQLTGTFPGTDEPATVVVTLRLVDGVLHMRPSLLVHAPAGQEDAVLRGATLNLDTRELPLGGPADKVQLMGGSVELSHERFNTAVTEEDFSPTLGSHG